jgi:hypothetical protein
MVFFLIINLCCLISIYLPSRFINSVMCKIFTSYFLSRRSSWRFGLFIATVNLSFVNTQMATNALPLFLIDIFRFVFSVMIFAFVVIARVTIHMGIYQKNESLRGL